LALGVPNVLGQVAPVTPDAIEIQRDGWQKVPEIFAAMSIGPGSRVADIGAGAGYFTVRLARAVGSAGRVFAVDVNPEAVRALQARVEKEGLRNVEVVIGAPADPRLPGSLDAALIVNTYHEIVDPQKMLDHIRQALKLTGRLVIVEPIARERMQTSRAQQYAHHEIAVDFVVTDLRQAGFSVLERRDRFVENLLDRDTEWLIVAAPQY
jgi:ubiquinone/menaquinone biosynthesis C-methylase UbiE